MNSTKTMIAGINYVDLASNAHEISAKTLSHTPNLLSRRYKEGGATFTANRHGIFETRKRRRSDSFTVGHKRARLESTRKSIHYDAVYQNQRAVKKHIIVRRPTDLSQPGKFYIIRCDQHDISFEDNPLQSALTHLRAKHGVVEADHDTVIEHLGTEVIECDDKQLEQNNAIARKAFEDGTNALGRDSIRVCDDSDSPKPPKSKMNGPGRPAARGMHSRNPMGSHQRRSQRYNQDIALDLVPGNIYIIWWFETKQWFAGLLLPPQNLESVGIYDTLEKLDIFKTLPSCYQYDSSSKSLSWAKGYEEGGPRSSERCYPFVFFEGFKFPDDCHKAWIQIDEIQPWDDEKVVLIEHSDQAIEFLREQREQKERENQRLGGNAEILDSMDDGESLQRDRHTDSDRDHGGDSDLDEFGPSSPMAESSTDNQAIPEPNIATPDTIDEQEATAQPEEVSKEVGFDSGHDTWIQEQLGENNQEIMDVDRDEDDPPAPEPPEPLTTTVQLPELTVQQEEVPKDPDIDPEQATQPQELPIQDNDEMGVVPIGDIDNPDRPEELRQSNNTSEEPEVVTPPQEMLYSGDNEAEKDIIMTTPSEDHSTHEESGQSGHGIVMGTHDDFNEETPAADTPGTDSHHISEGEDDDTSQQSELTHQSDMDRPTVSFSRHSSEGSSLPRYKSNERSQSTRETGQDRWTNEDICRMIGDRSPETNTTEGHSSGMCYTPEPTSIHEQAPVEQPASTRAPEQDLDLVSLLQEGESLELQMSQSEPTERQDVTHCQSSPTSSDHDRLACNIFNTLMAEERQPATPSSLPRTYPSHKDTRRPRAALADMSEGYSASSPNSEGRSQLSPYAEMGEPASVHSRPVSKGSDVQPASYEETGTPASTMRQSPATVNPTRGHSYDEMGQKASVHSRPSTANSDIIEKRSSNAEMGQRVSAAVCLTNELHPKKSQSGSMDQRTFARSPPLYRGFELQPQVTETARQGSPAGSHRETCPTSQSTTVQMPLRGAGTHQSPRAKPSRLHHMTTSPPEPQVEITHLTPLHSASKVIAPPQQPVHVPSQVSGVPRNPLAPPIVGVESPQSISAPIQHWESVVLSSCQSAIAKPLPSPTTQPSSASQLPSSPRESARDFLGLVRQTESPVAQPGHGTSLPPSRAYSSPDFSPLHLGQQGAPRTFKTPTMGNIHVFQEAMRSSGQPVIQSPQIPSISQSTPMSQVMPSPRPSNKSISRSSSLSQGYTIPPPQPLPSPHQLAGEIPRPISATKDFRVPASPHQPSRELTRPQSAIYGQPRPQEAIPQPYAAPGLPPPSTLAHGPSSLQVSASPRLQAMEISRPSSAVHEGRPPTSPRHHAMGLGRPTSIAHGAPVNATASPRIAAMSISPPGSIVHGQHQSVRESPRLAAKEMSGPSSTAYAQYAQSAISSPRQTSITMPQPAPTIHEHVHQPLMRSSPQLRATQLPRPNTAGYFQSRSQAMPSPRQSAMSTPQAGSVAPLPPVVVSPRLTGASTPRPRTAHNMQGPPPVALSPRPGPAQMEPFRPRPQARHSNSSNGPLPPLHRHGGNYVPTEATSISHSRRHSHAAGQSYSYENGPQTSNSTPRSHAPSYQVPVQRPNSALRPASLPSYLPQHIAAALIERTGLNGEDIQPGDFLNYQNMYECPFCRAGMSEQAVFVQHLQRFCPYTQCLSQARQTSQVRH